MVVSLRIALAFLFAKTFNQVRAGRLTEANVPSMTIVDTSAISAFRMHTVRSGAPRPADPEENDRGLRRTVAEEDGVEMNTIRLTLSMLTPMYIRQTSPTSLPSRTKMRIFLRGKVTNA